MQLAVNTFDTQIHLYKQNIDTNNLDEANNILKELIQNYPKDRIYQLLLLLDRYKDGYLEFHKSQIIPRYYHGMDIKDKHICIYSDDIKYIFLSMKYLPLLQTMQPKKITLQVPTKWLYFFQSHMPDIYTIEDLTYTEVIENKSFDTFAHIFSLPYLFQSDKNNIPKTPLYLHKNTTNNKSLHICIITNKDISLNIQANTTYISYTKEDIVSITDKLYNQDIIITDKSDIAHICGVINKKCYFITPVISEFEWGMDTEDNTSVHYKNIFLIRENISFENIILNLQKYISIDINNHLNKQDINKYDLYNYSFSKNTQTIFDKNYYLYKDALKYYEECNFYKAYDIALTMFNHYPDSFDINNLLAKLYTKENTYKKALHHILLAIKENPKHSDSYFQLGNILYNNKEYEKSLIQYQNALLLDTTNIEIFNAIAMTYQYKLKDNNKALSTFEKCIKICDCSKHEFIYYNIGVYYQSLARQDYLKDAIYFFKQDININPDSAKSYNNMGNCYKGLKQHKNSLECFQKAIKIDKFYDKAYSNLGITYKYLGDIQNAIKTYENGLLISKDNHKNLSWNLSLTYLLRGDLQIGWELYENRLYKDEFKVYRQYLHINKEYNSQDLTNKHILIYHEQGFGDTIQFIRYLDLLNRLNPRKITMIIQDELLSLAKYAMPEYDFIPSFALPPKDYDYHCALMSLPYIFNSSIDTIPNKIPYLYTPKTANIYEFDKNKFNIAIVWKSSDTAFDGEDRNIHIDYFYDLLQLCNIQLYSMQVGVYKDEYKDSKLQDNIIDLTPYINDFSDSANIIQNIDLVISIDTAIVHLCGALNTPCFMIYNPYVSWRWLIDKEDTIWYNSVKIYEIQDIFNKKLLNDISIKIQDKKQNKSQIYPTKKDITFIDKPKDNHKYLFSLLSKSYEYYNNSNFQDALKLAIRVNNKIENEQTLYILAYIYYNLFFIHKNNLYIQSSIFYFQKLLRYKQDFDFYYKMAILHRNDKENISKFMALTMFEKAYNINPSHIQLINHLLDIYNEMQYDKKSILLLNIVINKKIDINNTYKYLIKLALLYKEEQPNKAINYLHHALELNKNHIETYVYLSVTYKEMKDYKNTIKYATIGIQKQPDNYSLIEVLGITYKYINNIQSAKKYYQILSKSKGNQNNPSVQHNLAFLYFLQHNFKDGFFHHEKRIYFDGINILEKPFDKNKRYNNESLKNKTIIISYEQGYGDMIQFSRFIYNIQEKQPKKIILLIRSALLDLFKASFQNHNIEIKRYSDKTINFHYDYYIFMMSIPYILGLNISKIPIKAPYIKYNKEKDIKLNINKTKLNIAIVWEANRLSSSYDDRSSSLSAFLSLFDIPNTNFYSLQVGKGIDEIYHLKLQDKIINTSKYLNNFNDTASIIDKMDIVISIDTVIAHLSGALDKTCLTLIPYNPNWRWGISSKTSIWYKSLEIFRVKENEHYEDLIQTKIYPIIKQKATDKLNI
jgi:tetratricopeptide (TPR) repeat protein